MRFSRETASSRPPNYQKASRDVLSSLTPECAQGVFMSRRKRRVQAPERGISPLEGPPSYYCVREALARLMPELRRKG